MPNFDEGTRVTRTGGDLLADLLSAWREDVDSEPMPEWT